MGWYTAEVGATKPTSQMMSLVKKSRLLHRVAKAVRPTSPQASPLFADQELRREQQMEVERYWRDGLQCRSSVSAAADELANMPLEELDVRRRAFREGFVNTLGGILEEPIEPKLEREERVVTTEHAKIDLVAFPSRQKGQTVLAYLATPAKYSPSDPGPALLALHGIDSDPDRVMGLAPSGYLNNLGVRLVERGYTVLAPFIFSDSKWVSQAQRYLRYNGQSLERLVLAKTMACIDVLSSLDAVDNRRIGVYGISWGAGFARYTQALDERVQIGVSSGNAADVPAALADTRWSLAEQREGVPSWPAGNFSKFDLVPLVAYLIAPRPFVLEWGLQDDRASYGMDSAAKILSEWYGRLGYPDNLVGLNFDGSHEINPGDETLNTIERVLFPQKVH